MTEQKTGVSKEERVGYHKGALATLVKEQQELLRLVGIVEQLIKMHVQELKKLGVDVTKQVKEKKSLDEELN